MPRGVCDMCRPGGRIDFCVREAVRNFQENFRSDHLATLFVLRARCAWRAVPDAARGVRYVSAWRAHQRLRARGSVKFPAHRFLVQWLARQDLYGRCVTSPRTDIGRLIPRV